MLADMYFVIQLVESVVGADHADFPYSLVDSSFHDAVVGFVHINDRLLTVLGYFHADRFDLE